MAFLKHLITFWRVSRDWLFLAYVHSHKNPQMCTKFDANRSNRLVDFPDFWIFDPQNAPWGIEGLIVFSL